MSTADTIGLSINFRVVKLIFLGFQRAAEDSFGIDYRFDLVLYRKGIPAAKQTTP